MRFRSKLRHARAVLVALACLLGLFACTIGGRVGSGGVLQQDWDKRHGPVVPHDTFPRDCSMCHAGTAWTSIRPDFVFDHLKETGVELRGAHARAECLRCHNDRGPVQQFSQQGCVGCHDDTHRGKQGANCTSCHNELNWDVNDAMALHSKTRFPLFGVHASVECWRCHEGAQVGNFDRAPIECVSCHKEQLASATNPNHLAQGWVTDCSRCHAPVSWGEGDFNHSWFPLIGHHAQTETHCVQCHTGGEYHGLHNQCVDCHQDKFDGATSPQHAAAGFVAANCQSCHTPVGWSPAAYTHTAAFPLTFGHSVPPRACSDCHAGGQFQGTTLMCVGCHLDTYNGTTTPNHIAAGYPTTCGDCHDTTDFHHATFNHSSWPLTGTHRQTLCTACHTNPDYSTAPTLCIGCHQADYDGATNPSHVGFPTECGLMCHTTVHFTPAAFNHANVSTFPLSNAHAMPPRTCTDCHTNGNFSTTPDTCNGCHGTGATIEPVFNGSSNPTHQQLGTSSAVCDNCHNSTAWQPSTFDHSSFVLTGAHLAPTLCTQCHQGGSYATAPTNCVGCHLDNYSSTTNPPHAASNFATTCADCHNTTGWEGANFTHSMWPLTGLHASTRCTACHLNGEYDNAPLDCVGCHLANYTATTDPPHVSNGFPQTCATCHTTTGWSGSDFNHSWWPLTGIHATIACNQCHSGGNYTTLPQTDCYSCHQANYDTARNPPHARDGFPHTCETCHTTTGWTGADFNHSWWPLNGAHAVPPNTCTACHNGDYTTLPQTDCYSCHQANFNATTSPPHRVNGFAHTCQDCHDTNNWIDGTFTHTGVGFDLTGAHVAPPLACTACHLGGSYNRLVLPQNCAGCHGPSATVNPVYNTSSTTHAQLGRNPPECTQCHGNTTWTPSTFSHATWPLSGGHTNVSCSLCHTQQGIYLGAPTNCVGCHMTDYNGTTNPPHITDGFPTTCETCHTTAGWTGGNFNHSWWPLTGLHTVPPRACTDCHTGGNFTTNPPTTCSGCHIGLYNTTTDPPHLSNGFPTTCDTCHTTTGWTDSGFNHSWWPLTGAHMVPPNTCTACHNGNYTILPPIACFGCHARAYNTANPPHAANNFSQACQSCHSTTAWTDATFDHSPYFVLSGAHTSPPQACTACHLAGNYALVLPQTCVGCHGPGATVDPDFNGTSNTVHQQLGSTPASCSDCHSNSAWLPSTFSHTSYALTGGHITALCAGCHSTPGTYTGAPTDCWSCHQAQYNTTTTPNHVSANYPHTCDTCHTTAGWTGANFNHSWWPLTGLHTVPPRACTDCHAGGNYTTLPQTTCDSCHDALYQDPNNVPNHVTANFPLTCDTCHTTSGWSGATFNHSWWPLTGAHTVPPLACTQCHLNGNYTRNPPTTCTGCHGPGATIDPTYSTTTAPPHVAFNIPTTCQNCHTNTAWQPATFDHSSFPLTGAHVSPPLSCATCHAGGNYTTVPQTCAGCHGPSATIDPQYNSSSNLTHQQLGSNPPVCTMCHTNTVWVPSSFTHSTWPLTGEHTSPPATCAACHTGRVYTTAPTDCWSCHQTQYNTTTNPNHITDGFPHTCETCHTTAGWTGGTFNHSWWPLLGSHAVPPNVCVNCHAGGNYTTLPPTTCYGCHQADYRGAQSPSHVANNFPQTCGNCHDTNGWQPATFTHTGVGFDLTGAHVSPPLACGNCHVNGNYSGTLPTTCVGCHQSDYNGTTNPDHTANGIPTTCTNCHTTNANWTPVTMDHTGVTGACSSCHMADYNSTTSPDHEVQGYPLTCSSAGAFSCHTSTTSWTPNGFVPNTTHDATFPLPHHSSQCDQCHTTAQVFTAFSCISGGCHGQGSTDNHHNGVSGYQYNSAACYSCHPNGQALTGGVNQGGGGTSAVRRPVRVRPNRRMPPQPVTGITPAPDPIPVPLPRRP